MAEVEQIRYRKPRKNPTIRSKPTISSLISNDDNDYDTPKKKNSYFTSTKFRGLGCTAPAQVSVPTMLRKSANWELGNKKVRKKKIINSELIAGSSDCVPDVWCGPGIGLSIDAASDAAAENCGVSARNVAVSGSRGKLDVVNTRERGSYGRRRMVQQQQHQEELPFFDNDSHHRLRVFRSHHHHRHMRHHSPEGLAEIVMLQGNLIMGGRLDSDRYRDWRLDVDNMSYEQLLELGEKIGYVNTGLKEDEISQCVRKAKPPVTVYEDENKSSSCVQTEMQWKCTICQEEYEGEEEFGKLECGHFYHLYCIKQWLMHKKTCPVCKVEVKSQK
ncbi:uncharacterized protein [Rutidosis leptorrhynchoides]|uniref:uncharacterized protein n=1 Tax=Rutidosis leptorrhynchoides TaxID=125765 RepID=UPI003A9A645F